MHKTYLDFHLWETSRFFQCIHVFSNLKNTRKDINLRFTDPIYTSCHFVGFFGTLLSKFFHNILVENNKNTEAAFCNASSHVVSPPSFILDIVSAVSITTHLHVLSVICHKSCLWAHKAETMIEKNNDNYGWVLSWSTAVCTEAHKKICFFLKVILIATCNLTRMALNLSQLNVDVQFVYCFFLYFLLEFFFLFFAFYRWRKVKGGRGNLRDSWFGFKFRLTHLTM